MGRAPQYSSPPHSSRDLCSEVRPLCFLSVVPRAGTEDGEVRVPLFALTPFLASLHPSIQCLTSSSPWEGDSIPPATTWLLSLSLEAPLPSHLVHQEHINTVDGVH